MLVSRILGYHNLCSPGPLPKINSVKNESVLFLTVWACLWEVRCLPCWASKRSVILNIIVILNIVIILNITVILNIIAILNITVIPNCQYPLFIMCQIFSLCVLSRKWIAGILTAGCLCNCGNSISLQFYQGKHAGPGMQLADFYKDFLKKMAWKNSKNGYKRIQENMLDLACNTLRVLQGFSEKRFLKKIAKIDTNLE